MSEEPWTESDELSLHRAIIALRPIGTYAPLRLVALHYALNADLERPPRLSMRDIKAKLRTLYDVKSLNARELGLSASAASPVAGHGDRDDGTSHGSAGASKKSAKEAARDKQEARMRAENFLKERKPGDLSWPKFLALVQERATSGPDDDTNQDGYPTETIPEDTRSRRSSVSVKAEGSVKEEAGDDQREERGDVDGDDSATPEDGSAGDKAEDESDEKDGQAEELESKSEVTEPVKTTGRGRGRGRGRGTRARGRAAARGGGRGRGAASATTASASTRNARSRRMTATRVEEEDDNNKDNEDNEEDEPEEEERRPKRARRAATDSVASEASSAQGSPRGARGGRGTRARGRGVRGSGRGGRGRGAATAASSTANSTPAPEGSRKSSRRK